MSGRILIWLLITVLLTTAPTSEAQQPEKVPRIGFLITSSPSAIAPRMDAFRQGLRELGYVEGKNIVIERRHAEGKFDHLPALAAELVRLNVDIIVTSGPTATRPAKEATSTIPIVMTFDDDPVGSGFVTSLARPGGNITGLSTLSPEISGKQLELLKEIVPKLGRVAVIGTSSRQGTAQSLKETELAAGAFGVKLQYLDIQNPKEIESVFRAASKGRAHELRREHFRLGPARRNVCGQDPQRSEARRSPFRAAEEVRVHHQSQSHEADRPDDSAQRSCQSRQCDPMSAQSKIQNRKSKV
jgi:ABC-type uncharacterized transport system substrate-binding protein